MPAVSEAGDGGRVEKTGGSSTPTLHWGGEQGAALAESNLSGTIFSEVSIAFRPLSIPTPYSQFPTPRLFRIARRDISSGNVYYYLSDQLGSANVVTNATGVIQNESDFYPYGGEYVITQNLTQDYKFQGKERDSETGNDYFGARYYASSMGRFLSPDWADHPEAVPYASLPNPQSLNLYAFTGNNPLSRVDTDGHLDADAVGGQTDSQGDFEPGDENSDGEASLGLADSGGDPDPANPSKDTTQEQQQYVVLVNRSGLDAQTIANGETRETVNYSVGILDSKGELIKNDDGSIYVDPHGHNLELDEKVTSGTFDTKHGGHNCQKGCVSTVTGDEPQQDGLVVTKKSGSYSIEKRFKIDGAPAKVIDAKSKDLTPHDYVRVDAAFGKNFVFNYIKDSSQ